MTAIERGAFANLNALKSVILPDSLLEIGDEAFLACRSLRQISFPPSLKHIGQRAFKNSGLESVTITQELDYLGAEAFMQCENLTTVSLRAKLPSGCRYVFKMCEKLGTVNYDKDLIAPSFVASLESRNKGDIRPTFFDLFQGTPFYRQINALYRQKVCPYCGGEIGGNNVCKNCQIKYYKKTASGCYVATCVYGSYDCPEVWTLRRFRDDVLATTRGGKLLIHVYYAVSPKLVKWFGKAKWFQRLFKSVLDRLVAKLRKKGIENTPYEDKIR